MIYRLEVWNKITKKYEKSWEGHDFVRAQIQANKPYNNYKHHGKRRILSIETKIEMILPEKRKK